MHMYAYINRSKGVVKLYVCIRIAPSTYRIRMLIGWEVETVGYLGTSANKSPGNHPESMLRIGEGRPSLTHLHPRNPDQSTSSSSSSSSFTSPLSSRRHPSAATRITLPTAPQGAVEEQPANQNPIHPPLSDVLYRYSWYGVSCTHHRPLQQQRHGQLRLSVFLCFP